MYLYTSSTEQQYKSRAEMCAKSKPSEGVIQAETACKTSPHGWGQRLAKQKHVRVERRTELMEDAQSSRKRKLAALKARREQSNLANAALADQEEARFGFGWTFPCVFLLGVFVPRLLFASRVCVLRIQLFR